MEFKKTLTTDAGASVADNQNSRTAGPGGPILLEDHHLIEKLAHFDRERIPERVVHAKGSGAYGYFEVLANVTRWTKARFLAPVGKRTEIFVRFSTVAGEKGSADTLRDPRGFAIKFYTEDGNYDLVGNNTPVFFIRDPLKFPDFIHSQKRDPYSNIPTSGTFSRSVPRPRISSRFCSAIAASPRAFATWTASDRTLLNGSMRAAKSSG